MNHLIFRSSVVQLAVIKSQLIPFDLDSEFAVLEFQKFLWIDTE